MQVYRNLLYLYWKNKQTLSIMAINRRFYNDFGTPGSAAAIIISECVQYGTSKGWAGNEEFYEVEKI